MRCFTRPIEPYVVPMDEQQQSAYRHLRINEKAA
jgi:hypothetical protein